MKEYPRHYPTPRSLPDDKKARSMGGWLRSCLSGGWLGTFAAALVFSGLLGGPTLSADIPTNLKPLSVGLGGFNYWTSTPFANSFLTGGGWIEYDTNWGNAVFFYNTDGTLNPQFDSNGYPKYLNPGKKLRILLWPYSANEGNRPPSWPNRAQTGIGKWVVTWQGDADIRLQGATFVAGESSGAATGRLLNGRRVYMSTTGSSGHLTVEEINAANPVSDIKVWLPDPANPQNASLEGQFWHPTFIASLQAADFNHLRFMDWGVTNASPQQDWADRRRPDFGQQRGVLHRRNPAPGTSINVTDRSTGVAYEHMVALCNLLNRDMWVCVPHLATDDYVTKLAQLIRYGSDGVNPYTSPQANPLFPPLASHLKVYLEYSNEIWSNGSSFPQGNWAEAQGVALGLSPNPKARFNARRSSQIWRLFQVQFGGSARIVRVAAIWTGSSNYTNPFLTELRDYGPTLSPAVATDLVSPTTYFGNGIQDWAYEQANLTRGTADQWFHTDQDFTSGSVTRPVSVPASDPYWASQKLTDDLQATFIEWKKRIFSGSTAAGGGPDSTGVGGGFSATLRSDIQSIFGQSLPIVAYEGGPSLYADYYDGGDTRDDGITTFLDALNRRPEFAEIYRIQLNMARAKGLDSHSLFVDVSRWGKFGQWGHLEYMDQPVNQSVKWTAVSDWAADMAGVRHVDAQVNARPTFLTPGTLPIGLFNTPYEQDLVATGGDFAPGHGPVFTVVGSLLADGMTISPVPGDPWRMRLSGSPQQGGWNFVYLRVADDDGDATWQIFSAYMAGGPGTVVESNLTGSFAGASSLPWTAAHTVDPALTFSGLDIGAPFVSSGGTATGTDGTGVRLWSATDAIRFSVSQGSASAADSTLTSALADNEYWKFTVTPQSGQPLNLRKARLSFTWNREEYHAPRYFAVFTSVGGFNLGQQIYTLTQIPSAGTVTEHVFDLPDTAAYSNLTTPVEFRIYFYGSQYAHKALLLGLKLTRDPALYTVMPVLNPPAGSYAQAQTVALSTPTPGATIKYTTNGTNPSRSSGLVYSNPIQVTSTTTVKAMAYKDGMVDSAITTGVYTILQPVATPSISPSSGTYTSSVAVSLSTATSGATIRYTTDGSTPSQTHGITYTGTINLSQSATVKAMAFKAGMLDSPVASATYTIQVAAPAMSPAPGTYTTSQSVTLSSATSGATLRYTVDGSTPTVSHGTVYSGPVNVSQTTTIRAIAYKAGTVESEVTTGLYTISGGGAPSDLLAEDTFNYAVDSLLEGLSGGGSFGWNGPWVVEQGLSSTGFKVVSGSLEVDGLFSDGNRLEGGFSYRTCGRAFDINGAFASFKNASNRIGADGTTLWLSWVVKLASTANGYRGKVALDHGGAVFHDNNGIVRVLKNDSSGQWELSLLNGSHVQSTGVTATTNPTLMVLRIQFGTTDVVDLWVNPPVQASSPGSPQASLSTTGSIEFNEITWYPHNAVASGWLDEVRVGTTYAAVTPTSEVWVAQDIGAVNVAGSTTISGSGAQFTLRGSGADIWGSADGFHFARLEGGCSGDAEIVARVTSVQNTHSWAKAGVMIRESLAANSRHAMMVVTPSQGVAFQRRTSTGGSSAGTTVTGHTAPRWVKVTRTGNVFRGYFSQDGVNWTKVGPDVTIAMSAQAEIGLCLTSHANNVLCTAEFEEVTVTP